MIPTFYSTPERIADLEAAATAWLSTPYRTNSAVRGPGGGVSCHNLAAEQYFASGFLERFDVPRANIRALELGLGPALRDLFPAAVAARFAILPPGEPLLPGDLVLIADRKIIKHLGVIQPHGQFLHVLHHCGVTRSTLGDPTYTVVEARRPIP